VGFYFYFVLYKLKSGLNLMYKMLFNYWLGYGAWEGWVKQPSVKLFMVK